MEEDDVLQAGEVFEDPSLFDYLFGEDEPIEDPPPALSEDSHPALMAA